MSDWVQDPSRGPLNILVIRSDRLGDVVLSTPVFQALKKHYSHCRITVLVQASVAPALQGLLCVDEVLIFDPNGRHSGLSGMIQLCREIRAGRFRIAVVLNSRVRIAAAIFFAGIRHRVGPLSKIHSFLFFNRGIRQRRSEVEMHEADYNLQLLRKLGIRTETRSIPLRLESSLERIESTRAWLLSQGWNPSLQTVAIHPGMGGSALNWPEMHYFQLVRSLLAKKIQVIITAGPLENQLLQRFKKMFAELPSENSEPLSGLFFYEGGATGFKEVNALFGVFACVSVVVAPSTGPLHVAVALGKRVVTFYPPIRVQSALRWGPYLLDESRASVLVPEVYCGQEFKCLGSVCHYYPCMPSMSVSFAEQQVLNQLALERVANEVALNEEKSK